MVGCGGMERGRSSNFERGDPNMIRQLHGCNKATVRERVQERDVPPPALPVETM